MSTHTNRRQALSGFMTKTTGELHLYANGTTGSDAWDGSAAAWVPGTLIGPKKTRNAALALLPDRICHNTCVHFAGVFGAASETVNARLMFKRVDPAVTLLFDGGEDRTIVADNGGSPWAADISSTSTIGLTTLSWTVDAYMGYWVRVTSGPAAGQVRLIQSNTATTITTNSAFSVDPGAGATFDIIRPSTEFQYAAVIARFWGGGTVFFQNFYVTGSTTGLNFGTLAGGQCLAWVSNLITASTASLAFNAYGCEINMIKSCLNPTTFVAIGTTGQQCGVSQIGASALGLNLQHSNYGNLNNIVAKTLTLRQTAALYMSYCRIGAMTMDGCRTYNADSAVIMGTVKLGSLVMRDSSVSMAAAADVSGSASHGITVANNSYLNMLGAVTGSGNAGAGVYAHSGAIVHIKNGAAPTLTGTVGDLSFDGSTEASEWSAIDGGTPAVSSAELSMCKEVE